MFPLRDDIRSRRFPFVTYLIILLNGFFFWKELQLAAVDKLDLFLMHWGLLPAHLVKQPLHALPTVFSSMFLHGGWAHIIGNMWFLHIFGDNVEDAMGHVRFAVYYLFMGLCAGFAQAWANPTSLLPMIGASGAIAGVLGGYVVLYPRARVLTFFVLIVFIRFIEVPAYFFLGLWFVVQAFNSYGSLTMSGKQAMGGVAWWAHASGFVAGFVAVNFFKRRR